MNARPVLRMAIIKMGNAIELAVMPRCVGKSLVLWIGWTRRGGRWNGFTLFYERDKLGEPENAFDWDLQFPAVFFL